MLFNSVFSMMRLFPVVLIVFVCSVRLPSSKGWEKITCGKGVSCSCSNVRGNIRSASSSKCLRFLYGDDPDAQADEHCKKAKQNPNYCSSGGKKKREAESTFFEAESNHTIVKRSDYACANSPAVDARPCTRIRSWDSRRFAKIRAMQCPCCYVPSVKRSICGYNSCPCTRKRWYG